MESIVARESLNVEKLSVARNLTQVISYLRVDALREEQGVIPLNDNHRLRRWMCF